MNEYLTEITKDVAANRAEVIQKLLKFAETDLLLFWGQERDLAELQEKIWGPILLWAEKDLGVSFNTTNTLSVPEQEGISSARIKKFLNDLSEKELAAFYVVALRMKSILLAAAFVKKQVSPEILVKAAFLEENFQAQTWGGEEDFKRTQNEIVKDLEDIKAFLG